MDNDESPQPHRTSIFDSSITRSMMRVLDLDDPRIREGIEADIRRAPRLTPEQLARLALLFRPAPSEGDEADLYDHD